MNAKTGIKAVLQRVSNGSKVKRFVFVGTTPESSHLPVVMPRPAPTTVYMFAGYSRASLQGSRDRALNSGLQRTTFRGLAPSKSTEPRKRRLPGAQSKPLLFPAIFTPPPPQRRTLPPHHPPLRPCTPHTTAAHPSISAHAAQTPQASSAPVRRCAQPRVPQIPALPPRAVRCP